MRSDRSLSSSRPINPFQAKHHQSTKNKSSMKKAVLVVGSIDEAQIFNQALNSGQVNSLAAQFGYTLDG